MTKLIINGHEVTTNYEKGRYSYPICSGDDRKGWTMHLPEWQETPEKIVERLGKYYTRVSIYMVTTRVRGVHKYIIFCK